MKVPTICSGSPLVKPKVRTICSCSPMVKPSQNQYRSRQDSVEAHDVLVPLAPLFVEPGSAQHITYQNRNIQGCQYHSWPPPVKMFSSTLPNTGNLVATATSLKGVPGGAWTVIHFIPGESCTLNK